MKKVFKKVISFVLIVGVVTSFATVSASADDCPDVPGYGTCTITASTGDCAAGEQDSYRIRCEKGTAPNSGVVWKVSNTSAASISGSGRTATLYIKKNDATFTVTAILNGVAITDEYETCKLDHHVTSVTMNTNAVTISGRGNTAKVAVHLAPDNCKVYDNEQLPDVISSNSSVATGERKHSTWNDDYFGGDVIITAHNSGTATITVRTSNGVSASCRVTVTNAGGSTGGSASRSTGGSTGGSTKHSTGGYTPRPAPKQTPSVSASTQAPNTSVSSTVTKTIVDPKTGKKEQEVITQKVVTDPKTGKKKTIVSKTVTDPKTGKKTTTTSSEAVSDVSDIMGSSSDVSSDTSSSVVASVNESQNNTWIWIIIGVVAAGLVTAIIVIVRKSHENSEHSDLDKTQNIYSGLSK